MNAPVATAVSAAQRASSHPVAAELARLVRMLEGVRRQTRGWIWVESVAWLVLYAAAVFWLSLGLDWCIEPPSWVRAGVAVVAVAVAVWLVATRLVSRLAVPLPLESLALVVERCHPEFRDSLSTAIALGGREIEVDHDLLARTTAEAFARSGDLRPGRIFRRRRLALLAATAFAAAASVAGFVAARPAAASLWARRLALLDDEPWPRRVALEIEDFPGGVRTVARGSDVELIVHAHAARGGPPEEVDLRSRGAAGWRSERMGMRGAATADGQTFGHVVRAVVQDLELEVRGGDARLRGLVVRTVEPPELAALEIRAALPQYLGGGSREPPAARIVSLPRGSRVELLFRSTKPLSAAAIVHRGEGNEDRTIAEVGCGATEPVLAIAGVVDPLDGDGSVVVTFVDTDGLAPREPIRFALVAVPDEPPRVSARLACAATAVTPRGRLMLEGTIVDDHAVAAADVEVAVTRGAAVKPRAMPPENHDSPATERFPITRVKGSGPLVEIPSAAPEVVPLERLDLAVGDRIAVTVAARDACGLDGGPQQGRGETWSVDVVAAETLQAMLEAREIVLRRRFEAAINDFAGARERFAGAGPPGRATDEDRSRDGVRFGEAVARATGETTEIAAAYRGIRMELDANALLAPEVENRLLAQIAEPLEALAATDLPRLETASRAAATVDAAVARRADELLGRMRAILAKMMELESFNEVVERLRGVIRTQEEIRAETIERQKRRAREALEGP